MKIGIVLLNFRNYKDTIECINSLEIQEYKKICICVVDNFSCNKSIEKIKESINNKYNNVYYIENKKNMGFAKGNNVGIHFLREDKKCDLIFVLNTDTVISDKYFFNKVIKYAKKIDENIAVINPMCYNIHNHYMYPSFKCKYTIKKYLNKLKIGYLKYFIKALFNTSKINNRIITLEKLKELDNYNYVIQGCSYFLTPNFFKHYNELYSGTFLYGEELALAIYLDYKNLKVKNCYDLLLLHKEGGSSIQNGGIKKRLKKLQRMIDSYKSVKKLYNRLGT